MTTEDLSGLPIAPEGESSSLEDHEAAFGPNGTGALPESSERAAPEAAVASPEPDAAAAASEKARDEAGRFQKTPRHRAKSQQASAEDVPRIQELTKRLRDAEAERDALKNRPAEPARPTPAPASQPQRQSEQAAQPWTPPPTRPKPSEDEIGDKYKTYADFTEDLADWKIEQREVARETRQQHEKQQQTYRDWQSKYAITQPEFVAKTPDYHAVMAAANAATQAAGLAVPQVLTDAILSSERVHEVEYFLATHQADYHDLIRDAWAVNQFSSVGMVRRVLESKLSPVASAQRARTAPEAAGTTGAAPRLTVVPAPRPPTPVRTGPLKIGEDVPDDEDGLEAHESYFHKSRR